ncbi:MAG: hypothetical protein QM571_04235 [Micrococcaceae bacterium]
MFNNQDNTAGNNAGSGISRRGVVKSSVWTVPVVTAAVATPATMASPGDVSYRIYFDYDDH